MGAVYQFAEDLVNDIETIVVVTLIVIFPFTAIVLASICDECEHYMSEQIGKVFSWIGIDDEDVISVQAQDQLLITNDSFYKSLMTQVAIQHQRSQRGIIELLAIKSQGVRGSLGKYYSYGKNKFIDGEPTTTINTVKVDIVAVDEAITYERGIPITVLKTDVRAPTETEWVAYSLTKSNGYNPTTQILSYSGEAYQMTGFAYNYSTGNYDVTIVQVVVPNTTVVLYVLGFVPAVSYVTRYIVDGSSDVFYWIYTLGGSNAALNAARNYLTDLDMLPIIELRSNSTTITADKESIRYKQSKEILGFIGIDVDNMCKSIESNPDIASITASYIYFGAELGSSDPIQAKLLYNIIGYLYEDPTLVTESSHTIRVQEGNYNSSISWETQERTAVFRVGTPIGTYEGGVGVIEILEDVLDTDGSVLSTTTSYKYYGYVRKQETSSHYIEYRLYNVVATTLIAKGAMYDVTMSTLSTGTTIVFPLSTYFIHGLTPIEQGKVFPNILRMVTYAANIQHLEYYQTQAFFDFIQVVMIIAAIVIFIFTWYTGGATSAAFIAAVEALLLGMAIGYALTLLLASTDNIYLKMLIVAAAVVVATQTGDMSAISSVVFTADLVLTAVTQYADSILEAGYAELKDQSTAFWEKAQEAEEKLNEYADMFASMLNTEEVQKLTRLEPAKAYVESFEMQRYRASVDFMCNWELTKSMKMQTNIYDYDQHYRVNVLDV